MWKNLLVLALAVSLTDAKAGERLSVEDNSEEVRIKDAIREVARQFSSENVTSYSGCFCKSARKAITKEAAFVFAENECRMSIVDSHIITINDRKADVAVKYTVNSQEIVSCVSLIKEDEAWVIKGEAVRSRRNATCSSVGDSASGGAVIQCGGGGCADGRCLFPTGDNSKGVRRLP